MDFANLRTFIKRVIRVASHKKDDVCVIIAIKLVIAITLAMPIAIVIAIASDLDIYVALDLHVQPKHPTRDPRP